MWWVLTKESLSFPLQWPAPRSVLDVENDKLITLDCIENRVFESTDVPATNAGLFGLLCHIGVFEELQHCAVYAVGKISDYRWSVVAQVRNAIIEIE